MTNSSNYPDYPQVRQLTISDDEAGQRIDNYLLRILKGVPKTHIYKIIRTGQVRVNKKRIKPIYKIKPNDVVRVPPVRFNPAKPAKPKLEFLEFIKNSIIFEDDLVLVINKPAGMAVHGGSGVNLGLIEAIRNLYPKHITLELVHRLDKPTSGCLLIAKKRSYLRQLHQALRENNIRKTYLALLKGKLTKNPIKCDKPLKKNTLKSGERMVTVDADGKAALTIFKPIKQFQDTTLAEIELITGRTHQIRVHAQNLGHAVIGDIKYGSSKANAKFKKSGLNRMFLHANQITFPHPERGELTVTAPLDDALNRILSKLS